MLACGAAFTCSASDESARLRAIVDATVQPLMARHDIPGMAVALSVDGRSHVFHYGLSSKQDRTPVTASTRFEIGSVSKMFTTTLAALAQAQGQLRLDAHPGDYLPRLKGRPIDRATLVHLGTYTAGGLPLQFPGTVGQGEAVLDYFQAWQAEAPPGTVRQYSNPSIGLLGVVTATAMQDSYARLVETHILRKLGMHHTHVRVPPEAMADYAWGYSRRPGEDRAVRVNPGPLDEEAYGIKSTAADMIRFVQAQIDPGALEAPLRRAIETTQVGHFRVGGMVQGFGWEQFPYPLSREALLAGHAPAVVFEPNAVQPEAAQPAHTRRLFNKTGSTGGFGAYVVFVPAQRVGVVMLANRSFPLQARVDAAYALLQQISPPQRAGR